LDVTFAWPTNRSWEGGFLAGEFLFPAMQLVGKDAGAPRPRQPGRK